ncbi:Mitogen-activated protein kinase kinase kinase YODA [Dendrobium catenatum]|uniref:mitogen-activated protein kinase kinase kinase n=1 Tax=Dendrobium catenatum TaxID=906689 RepID=A0A2I0WGU7_9ASPA|nr:Mitogen-activated protein kinase kinase kinase YODA [Dendrobium catenatum]
MSPSYSPAIRSPILKLKNPSAPQSPLHPKIYSENSSAWHDNNMNLNVHPLPLPPGPAVLPQPNFSHQNANKNEGTSMTSQWQKQKLIGSGTFGNVYRATNRHTGALCAMKEVNIIPDDPKSRNRATNSFEISSQLERIYFGYTLVSRLKHLLYNVAFSIVYEIFLRNMMRLEEALSEEANFFFSVLAPIWRSSRPLGMESPLILKTRPLSHTFLKAASAGHWKRTLSHLSRETDSCLIR